jgi:hypothetical protein
MEAECETGSFDWVGVWRPCLRLLFAASLAGIVQGGALDPPGAPASTMKTLDDIPGSWSRELSATGGCTSARFQCVFNNQAVLDRETGLVWERVPTITNYTWAAAIEACAELAIVNRLGWRLPTFDELNSLIVLDAGDDFPDGHPFSVTPSTAFWSLTTDPGNTVVWGITTSSAGSVVSLLKTGAFDKWCVRGGEGINGH